jgi:Cu/Ag efflux protein CusF
MKFSTLVTAATIALASTGSAWSAELADGMIKKIDTAQKKITIKHGPLMDLEMPAMTMVFAAGETLDLTKLKAGQKVKFMASRVNGRLTVTEVK